MEFARVGFIFVVFVGRSWRCSECFAKSAALEARVAFLWGVGSILNGFFDEWNQSSTSLVEKEVLSCRDVVFANCTRKYQVFGN